MRIRIRAKVYYGWGCIDRHSRFQVCTISSVRTPRRNAMPGHHVTRRREDHRRALPSRLRVQAVGGKGRGVVRLSQRERATAHTRNPAWQRKSSRAGQSRPGKSSAQSHLRGQTHTRSWGRTPAASLQLRAALLLRLLPTREAAHQNLCNARAYGSTPQGAGYRILE